VYTVQKKNLNTNRTLPYRSFVFWTADPIGNVTDRAC
jgi:hypothetical protein